MKAKFKVKNVHSSKENHSGFDFPALPSLTRMRTGDGVVGQEGKGGADSERRRKRGARGGGGGGVEDALRSMRSAHSPVFL